MLRQWIVPIAAVAALATSCASPVVAGQPLAASSPDDEARAICSQAEEYVSPEDELLEAHLTDGAGVGEWHQAYVGLGDVAEHIHDLRDSSRVAVCAFRGDYRCCFPSGPPDPDTGEAPDTSNRTWILLAVDDSGDEHFVEVGPEKALDLIPDPPAS